MLKKTFLFLLSILFIGSCFSQSKCVIKGTASSFIGKRVKLCAYSDQISYSEETIATTIVDKSGRFELTVATTFERCAYLYIDNIKGLVYLEPKKTFEVKFPSKQELVNMESESRLHSLIPLEIPLEFQNMDTTSLNYLIGEYNYFYNNFVADHYQELRNARNKKAINLLKESTQQRFGFSKNKYLHDYIRYREASMEQWQHVKSTKDIVQTYLNHQTPLWENTEYMHFFNQMFNQHLTNSALSLQGDSIFHYINDLKSYSGMIRILASDSTLLPNDTLRELVLMKGLFEVYQKPGFNHESIISILDYIEDFSNIQYHKKIAESLIKALKRFESGMPSNGFVLNDFEGTSHKSTDFLGKKTYLVFWNTWNIACVTEMAMIDTLYQQFSKEFNFVAICCDNEEQKAQKLITTYKLQKWTHLFAGDNPELLENYGVASFPTFILVDEEMKILNHPARKPSEKLSEQFWQIVLKKEADLKAAKDKKKIEEINNERK